MFPVFPGVSGVGGKIARKKCGVAGQVAVNNEACCHVGPLVGHWWDPRVEKLAGETCCTRVVGVVRVCVCVTLGVIGMLLHLFPHP